MNELDTARFQARLDQLWDLRRGPRDGADRPAYSSVEAAAMRLVAEWGRAAGLEPGVDRHGNLWCFPPNSSKLVTSGSHVDTVPDGGRYDGALGTLLALEIAEKLAGLPSSGAQPGVLVCAAEEASRFRAGTLGSRALVGDLGEERLWELRDDEAASAAECRNEYLARLSDLAHLDEPPLDAIVAHLEVHIEQHPALDAAKAQLGVVDAVSGQLRQRVVFAGEAAHAGAAPMDSRRDALAAAAATVLALEQIAMRETRPDAVATVGDIEVEPGTISVVPKMARLDLEVRAKSLEVMRRIERRFGDAINALARDRGVKVEIETIRDSEPAKMSPELIDLALTVAGRHGIVAQTVFSGAGHDVQHLVRRTRAGLLFVPLAGGSSHTPHEEIRMDDVIAALTVACDVLEAAAPGR